MSNHLYILGGLIQCAALASGADPAVGGVVIILVGLLQVTCWWGR